MCTHQGASVSCALLTSLLHFASRILANLRTSFASCVQHTAWRNYCADVFWCKHTSPFSIACFAGYTWDGVIHKMPMKQWEAMLSVHLTAPFRLIQAATPYMRDAAKAEIQKSGKATARSIINVSSTSGTHGNAGQVNYSTVSAFCRMTVPGNSSMTGMSQMVQGCALLPVGKGWGNWSDQDCCQGVGPIQHTLQWLGLWFHCHTADCRQRLRRQHAGKQHCMQCLHMCYMYRYVECV